MVARLIGWSALVVSGGAFVCYKEYRMEWGKVQDGSTDGTDLTEEEALYSKRESAPIGGAWGCVIVEIGKRLI